jgi:Phosphotransferase enzyme family
LPELERSERTAVYDEMNRVLSELHRVDPQGVGLDDFGAPGDYFARQIGRWTRQYRASQTHHIDALEHLIDWLPWRFALVFALFRNACIRQGVLKRGIDGNASNPSAVEHGARVGAVARLGWRIAHADDEATLTDEGEPNSAGATPPP